MVQKWNTEQPDETSPVIFSSWSTPQYTWEAVSQKRTNHGLQVMRNKEQRYCNGDKTGVCMQFPSSARMAQICTILSELSSGAPFPLPPLPTEKLVQKATGFQSDSGATRKRANGSIWFSGNSVWSVPFANTEAAELSLTETWCVWVSGGGRAGDQEKAVWVWDPLLLVRFGC